VKEIAAFISGLHSSSVLVRHSRWFLTSPARAGGTGIRPLCVTYDLPALVRAIPRFR
jgi:hypothetical protein